MLGREEEQMLLFGVGRKKVTIGRQGGYKYPQIWNINDYFRKPGTSGLDPGTSGNRRLQQTDMGAVQNFRGKTQRFRERCVQG
jgi:hypothetical protein